jgi:protease I
MPRLTGCLVVLLAVAAVQAQPFAPQVVDSQAAGKPRRTVLVFVPQQFFSEDEYEPTVRHLGMAGLDVKVVAAETTPAVGTGPENRLVVEPDLVLADVRAEDFAALVLIGGSGMALYWDDSLLHARCRDFAQAGKVVAAIGIAPITLARAGVLNGRKATVFPDRSAVGFLKAGGCRYSFRPLVTDRHIITAASAERVGPFARAVAAAVLRQ